MALIQQTPWTDKWLVSDLTGQLYKTKAEGEAAEAAWWKSPAGIAATQKANDIGSIKSQILGQWKQLGVPSIGGGLSIDERAQGLAERLYANQITDLTKLDLGTGKQTVTKYFAPEGETEEIPASYLTYGGRQIGFLGDIGTAENWQPTGYLQNGNLASWGAQGKGAVSYTVQKAPNGQVYFIPSWGSTSDLGSIAPVLAIGASLLAPGLGTALASGLGTSAAVGSTLAGGLIGGTLAEATGGDFLKGVVTGGLGAAAAPLAGGISEAVGGGMLGNAVGQGLTNAGMAAITGGDVEQALVMGAIGGAAKPLDAGINNPSTLTPAQIEAGLGTPGYGTGAQAAASGLFDTSAIGSGAYVIPSIPTVDTSFTPDYSLSLGAPVLPDMGAQGIQVPPVNQVVDVGTTPVDYSLVVPSAGLGLTMPTAPNIEAMGGGQGITVPAAGGGLLTESGVIPTDYMPVLGDPNSFINQPAPDSGVTINDVVEAPALTQSDIPWDKVGKLLAGLFATTAATQMAPQAPSIVDTVMSPYKPVDNMPVYDPAYFQSVQNYYNAYLPNMPMDVATPLSSWYNSTDIQPDKFTASLFNNQ